MHTRTGVQAPGACMSTIVYLQWQCSSAKICTEQRKLPMPLLKPCMRCEHPLGACYLHPLLYYRPGTSSEESAAPSTTYEEMRLHAREEQGSHVPQTPFKDLSKHAAAHNTSGAEKPTHMAIDIERRVAGSAMARPAAKRGSFDPEAERIARIMASDRASPWQHPAHDSPHS